MKALSFEGSGFEYFKIWIVNILLTIVTVGIYYPWAKVRNRRYFYANTTLEGRNFEYHATGKQLFIGYLIAMVLFIAYALVQQVSPIAGVVAMLIFVIALPWIIWRSLKFNMRMTSYSNVRFSFAGALSGSYLIFLVFPALLFVVFYGSIMMGVLSPMLGAKFPDMSWMSIILPVIGILLFLVSFYLYAVVKKKGAVYTISGSRFGQGEFNTELETKTFFIILLKTIAVSIGVLFATFLIMAGILAAVVGVDGLQGAMSDIQNPDLLAKGGALPVVLFGLIYLFMLGAFMFIFAYSMTRYRTYIYDHSNLDEKITFASTLKALPLTWVLITNLLMIIFTVGLALPWAKVRATRLFLENTLVDTDAGFDDYLTQKQEEGSALGEQIGDAFDIDVGIAL